MNWNTECKVPFHGSYRSATNQPWSMHTEFYHSRNLCVCFDMVSSTWNSSDFKTSLILFANSLVLRSVGSGSSWTAWWSITCSICFGICLRAGIFAASGPKVLNRVGYTTLINAAVFIVVHFVIAEGDISFGKLTGVLGCSTWGNSRRQR